MLPIKTTPASLSLDVYIQPKASKNEIVGVHGDALKIKLTAPPVDGAANAMCTKFLAKCLEMPKSSIEIVSGQTSRRKQIRIRAEGAEQIRIKKRIETLCSS